MPIPDSWIGRSGRTPPPMLHTSGGRFSAAYVPAFKMAPDLPSRQFHSEKSIGQQEQRRRCVTYRREHGHGKGRGTVVRRSTM